jgi:hypothetical protein
MTRVLMRLELPVVPMTVNSNCVERRVLVGTIGYVYEEGGLGWLINVGMNLLVAHGLGVRSVADLPVYD